VARKSKKITRRKETPNCVEISGFSEIELSDDGNAIIVSARLADSAEPTNTRSLTRPPSGSQRPSSVWLTPLSNGRLRAEQFNLLTLWGMRWKLTLWR